MNKATLLPILLVLSACDKSMPFESAEVLAENPERLEELNQLCKDDWEKIGNAQCNAVSK